MLILIASLIVLVIGVVHLFGFFKVNAHQLTLIIFPDGCVSLKSSPEDRITGVLAGQQWCTHQLAVLKILNGDKTRYLVIMSAQQQKADDFRCLKMWLRQDFSHGAGKKKVLDV